MEESYWQDKWANQQIGFHQKEPHAYMVQYHSALNLQPDDQVFVPLCGKTNDIGWLLNQGHRVCGVELNESAVQALFDNLALTPEVHNLPTLKRYQHKDLQVYVGDIFNLTADLLGPVHAIYDRAALVALPPEMRKRYTEHLRHTTNNTQQLLITFDYDQNAMAGPPHSVPAEEVHQHYNPHYSVHTLAESAVDGGLKKTTAATEVVWHLQPS